MKKIVIIGAGPAGLTAAYELLRCGKDYDVTLLEAGSIPGGISATVQCGGCRMDLGGHRLFSKDERIMNWWKNIMPVQSKPACDDKLLCRKKPYAFGSADPEKSDSVLLIRDRVSHIYYKNKFYNYPVELSAKMLHDLSLPLTAKVLASYVRCRISKLPETNLENFYINRFGRELYKMFFEGYTQKLWGKHPRDISAQWGAQRVKGLSLTAVMKDTLHKLLGSKKSSNTETSLIEQFWYPKLGSGQLWQTVADIVTAIGGHILYDRKVTGIQTNGGRIVSVSCGSEIFPADECISSMPIKELARAIGAPENIRTITDALPYRDLVIVGLLVKDLRLKNTGKKPSIRNTVPDCWIYVQDKRVKLGRLQVFNNWSPYIVKDPFETLWLGAEYFCSSGDGIAEMTDKQLAGLAAKELRRIGILGSSPVLYYHAERVPKAYPAYFGSYSRFGSVRRYLDSFDNLWCIGRNGQHRYNNMDHSMMTAIETAGAIKSQSRDKTPVWSVNTDKAYHEKK